MTNIVLNSIFTVIGSVVVGIYSTLTDTMTPFYIQCFHFPNVFALFSLAELTFPVSRFQKEVYIVKFQRLKGTGHGFRNTRVPLQ